MENKFNLILNNIESGTILRFKYDLFCDDFILK
jgi:hypothetical protein